MTELLVRPEAEVDAFEAASWYEHEREGLGSAFLARVRRVFKRIESGPLQFPLPMASNDDPNRSVPAARSGRFVVSDPCDGCHGQGNISGQTCPRCRGTGAERFFHGTKVDLKTGDLIKPGHRANFGNLDRTTTYVYLTATVDAATWGAELALGEGRGRIYIVEPTGPIEDDPNLTDKKFPGNPTRSYRSREPLRVIGEVVDWRGHDQVELKAMKDRVEQAKQQGVEPID